MAHPAVLRASVGIWLAHRDLWSECGGYDERMIYMNDMDTNMIERLRMEYELVDLGSLVGGPLPSRALPTTWTRALLYTGR